MICIIYLHKNKKSTNCYFVLLFIYKINTMMKLSYDKYAYEDFMTVSITI